MEELGRDMLNKIKNLSSDHRKDLWKGNQGITMRGSSLWNAMRNIMQSHRKYS